VLALAAAIFGPVRHEVGVGWLLHRGAGRARTGAYAETAQLPRAAAAGNCDAQAARRAGVPVQLERGLTMADLFDRTRPPFRGPPATLSRDAYADVLAYLLNFTLPVAGASSARRSESAWHHPIEAD